MEDLCISCSDSKVERRPSEFVGGIDLSSTADENLKIFISYNSANEWIAHYLRRSSVLHQMEGSEGVWPSNSIQSPLPLPLPLPFPPIVCYSILLSFSFRLSLFDTFSIKNRSDLIPEKNVSG